MSYSSPGGYGGPPQGPSTPGYGAQPAPGPAGPAGPAGPGKGMPFYFNIGVVVLGVLNFFLGFLPYISGVTAQFGGESISANVSLNFFESHGLVSTSLLLAAALVAGLGMLPKQDILDGVVASLSVVGFVSLLFQLVSLPGSAGIGLIIVLITSFIQAALAVTALLFAAEIIKPPAPKAPQYGYYGQAGYGQPQQPPSPPSQPQQPYYGAAPGPGSYPPPPPSQPPQW